MKHLKDILGKIKYFILCDNVIDIHFINNELTEELENEIDMLDWTDDLLLSLSKDKIHKITNINLLDKIAKLDKTKLSIDQITLLQKEYAKKYIVDKEDINYLLNVFKKCNRYRIVDRTINANTKDENDLIAEDYIKILHNLKLQDYVANTKNYTYRNLGDELIIFNPSIIKIENKIFKNMLIYIKLNIDETNKENTIVAVSFHTTAKEEPKPYNDYIEENVNMNKENKKNLNESPQIIYQKKDGSRYSIEGKPYTIQDLFFFYPDLKDAKKSGVEIFQFIKDDGSDDDLEVITSQEAKPGSTDWSGGDYEEAEVGDYLLAFPGYARFMLFKSVEDILKHLKENNGHFKLPGYNYNESIDDNELNIEELLINLQELYSQQPNLDIWDDYKNFAEYIADTYNISEEKSIDELWDLILDFIAEASRENYDYASDPQNPPYIDWKNNYSYFAAEFYDGEYNKNNHKPLYKATLDEEINRIKDMISQQSNLVDNNVYDKEYYKLSALKQVLEVLLKQKQMNTKQECLTEARNRNDKARIIWDECTPTRERRETTAEDIKEDINISAGLNSYEDILNKLFDLADYDEDDIEDFNYENENLPIEEQVKNMLSYFEDWGDGSPNIQYISLNGKVIFDDRYDEFEGMNLETATLEDLWEAMGVEEDEDEYLVSYDYAVELLEDDFGKGICDPCQSDDGEYICDLLDKYFETDDDVIDWEAFGDLEDRVRVYLASKEYKNRKDESLDEGRKINSGKTYEIKYSPYDMLVNKGNIIDSFDALNDRAAFDYVVDNLATYLDNTDLDEFANVEELVDYFSQSNGDGCDFIYYIKRPDGSYLFRDAYDEQLEQNKNKAISDLVNLYKKNPDSDLWDDYQVLADYIEEKYDIYSDTDNETIDEIIREVSDLIRA